jgi:mRNA interferase MazF
MVDLNPSRGHEQAGVRPGLLVSVDLFNHGPAGRIGVLPLTSVARGIPFHVELNPPEGGVKVKSFIQCEDIRSVAKEGLAHRWGRISGTAMAAVEDRLRILPGL